MLLRRWVSVVVRAMGWVLGMTSLCSVRLVYAILPCLVLVRLMAA